MNKLLKYSFLFAVILVSCKKEDRSEAVEVQRALKEKELVFNSLSKAWNFSSQQLTPESEVIVQSWNEWRLFINELNQKPKSTINAFKLKTKNLVKKADVLPSTIPNRLNKPKIKARLSALITKLKALDMFLNIDRIPEKRVIELVNDLNLEVNAFNGQIEEIVRRSKIQMEEGEVEMIKRAGGKKVDTLANPQPQTPQKEEIKSFEEIK
ncbi:hypothetical protein [Flavobacterium sp. H122]|uniref:hypothetical protein n=1 Tax=Flavobacterium sp. H122 TaxID=2529860 RepID=UPI0010AB3E9F|nr:hypothetical protein [Flavobacterium sp. H122]